MPPSNSTLAYRDIEEIFERAIANGKGIRIKCPTPGAAKSIQVRAYKYRTIDRKENKKIFGPDDPLHGRSAYDCLLLSVKRIKEQWYLIIEVSTSERLEALVEDLTDEEPDIVVRPAPPPITILPQQGIIIGKRRG